MAYAALTLRGSNWLRIGRGKAIWVRVHGLQKFMTERITQQSIHRMDFKATDIDTA